jgi:hypothetical protein
MGSEVGQRCMHRFVGCAGVDCGLVCRRRRWAQSTGWCSWDRRLGNKENDDGDRQGYGDFSHHWAGIDGELRQKLWAFVIYTAKNPWARYVGLTFLAFVEFVNWQSHSSLVKAPCHPYEPVLRPWKPAPTGQDANPVVAVY